MSEFDDPLDLFTASKPSGHRTAEGLEIRFLGPDILSHHSAFTNSMTPPPHRSHPLVKGQYFYTLPADLWDNLIAELGENRFDASMLEMERALSAACGDHASLVGFWQDRSIPFRGLRPTPAIPFTDEQFRSVGMNPIAAQHGIRLNQERDATPLERYRRSYVGWLMTSSQFLDEHDALLGSRAKTVRRWGTHRAGLITHRAQSQPGTDPNEDPAWSSFNAACETFFARWRLQGLAGPNLPIPLEALMAGIFPLSVAQHLMRCGGVFFLPDTMPIPSRDQLRGLLDDALHRGGRPEHLQEWLKIVRAGNPARNQLDQFARLFEVQHYWLLLYNRHPAALDRHVGHIEAALAKLFDCSPGAIHADRLKISKRLGKNWFQRASPIAGNAST